MGYLIDDLGAVLVDELDEPLWDEFGPDPGDPGDPGEPGEPGEPGVPTRYPWARLTAPGVPALAFDASAGWYVDRLDLGIAEHRDASSPAPDMDGSNDPTWLIGARDVIVAGTMIPDVAELWEMREALTSFASPRLRCTLTFQESPTSPVRMVRRARAFQIPTRANAAPLDAFRVVLRVERGVIESADERSAIVYASGAGASAGRTYPLIYPRTYPQAPPVGSTPAVNAGRFDASPVMRVFGPCAGIEIENRTVGRALVFDPSFALNVGEYLEIDVAARTIRLNGDPAQSRQSALDFASSRWWSLASGTNDLRFTPTEYVIGARVEVIWHDTWLG